MIDEKNGVNYINVKGYNRDGSPVFKKKIIEVNVLNKRTNSEKVVFGIVFAIFVLHSITLIFPTLWMFMSSFKGALEYAGGDPFAMPDKWRWENFIDAFRLLKVGQTTFGGMILNSLW